MSDQDVMKIEGITTEEELFQDHVSMGLDNEESTADEINNEEDVIEKEMDGFDHIEVVINKGRILNSVTANKRISRMTYSLLRDRIYSTLWRKYIEILNQ
jgi:hypothetical protein